MPRSLGWVAITYGLTLATAAVAVIPCGRDAEGLPFGIQVAGPNGSDARVLAIALALEQAMAGDPELARPLPDLKKLGA